ncbi:MAG: Stealth CR1 domain-containing protein [Treponema sp.]|nr:Stealth CR1 domain-containing protein [Treponema sp.]
MKKQYDFPVDLVYLWCDGSDKNFANKKNELKKKLNISFDKQSNGNVRYIEHNELKFSLRSVQKFAPWINHIYIVTDNQKPKWLKENSRLTIIDHKDIIPKNILPTFNSCVIEFYIHKIKNLSEHFLYANDDFIFFNTVQRKDYFDKKGNPIVWVNGNKGQIFNFSLDRVPSISGPDKKYRLTIYNSWDLFCKKNHLIIPGYTLNHCFTSLLKSDFEKILLKYPEVLETNIHPFRDGKDINRIIFQYEMIYILKYKFHYANISPILIRIIRKFFKVFKISFSIKENRNMIYSEKIKDLQDKLKTIKPLSICLNAIPDDEVEYATSFFEQVFPIKSEWEK